MEKEHKKSPFEMSSKELRHYNPPIKRRKNEDITSYKLRQLDYWLSHTWHDGKGLIWFNPKEYGMDRA